MKKSSTKQPIIAVRYPLTIPIPYSAILVGTHRDSEFMSNDILETPIRISMHEYNVACRTLIFIAIPNFSKPCIVDEQDNILTIKHHKDSLLNEAIDKLISLYLIYKNAKKKDCYNTTIITTYTPFIPTSIIVNLLFNNIEAHENQSNSIEEKRILLKTELSIRNLYELSICENLQYSAIISEYIKLRKSLMKYYEMFCNICKFHTIRVME